jgi:signal transduction histidine kinase
MRCAAMRTCPTQQEHLDAIATSSESLLGIVNEILDLSKIEAGKLGTGEGADGTAPRDRRRDGGDAFPRGREGLDLGVGDRGGLYPCVYWVIPRACNRCS